MLQLQTFVGGIFDTNGYLIQAPGGNILIDAPTGIAGWLQQLEIPLDFMLITHGHVDHVDDAARVKKLFGCKVAYHRETEPLVMDPNFFKKFGFFLEAEPVAADFFIEPTAEVNFQGMKFQILYVPGHCPGSVCFYSEENQVLFAGDTLFSGSIGRADLPGGDYNLLVRGIQKKIFSLPDQTRVLSGHGPETTVGEEKRTNPYLR